MSIAERLTTPECTRVSITKSRSEIWFTAAGVGQEHRTGGVQPRYSDAEWKTSRGIAGATRVVKLSNGVERKKGITKRGKFGAKCW